MPPDGIRRCPHQNANTTTGLRAAPLTDIKITTPDARFNWKPIPTCSAREDHRVAKRDRGCPKGAPLASGTVTADARPDEPRASPRAPAPTDRLHPAPRHLERRRRKVVELLFVITAAPVRRAADGRDRAVRGTVASRATRSSQDAPLPPDVSTNAGNLGTYDSLTTTSLKWSKITAKVKGKTGRLLRVDRVPGGARTVHDRPSPRRTAQRRRRCAAAATAPLRIRVDRFDLQSTGVVACGPRRRRLTVRRGPLTQPPAVRTRPR